MSITSLSFLHRFRLHPKAYTESFTALSIQHNLSALNINRQFEMIMKSSAKYSEKLSSGYRINRAADDASGLSLSKKNAKADPWLTAGIKKYSGWDFSLPGCKTPCLGRLTELPTRQHLTRKFIRYVAAV